MCLLGCSTMIRHVINADRISARSSAELRSSGLQLEQVDTACGTPGNGSSHICGEQGGKSASKRRRGRNHGEEGQVHEEVEEGRGARRGLQ